MSKPIEWSPQSKRDYLKLLDYLQGEWGEKVINKFNNRLQTVLKTIAERPQLYPSSKKTKNVRRCVLSKQPLLSGKER